MSPTSARDTQRAYCSGRGSVQAEFDPQRRHLRRVGQLAGVALAQHDLGRVPRRQIQQRKADRRDAQEQQRQRGQPSGQVCSHAGYLLCPPVIPLQSSLGQPDAVVDVIEVGRVGVEVGDPLVDTVHQVGVGHRKERGFGCNDVQRPAGYLLALCGV